MKKIASVLLATIILFTISSVAYASEQMESTKIKVGDISVTVPYNQNDIQVIREENFQEFKVTINDIKTGRTIRVVGEMKPTSRTNYNKTMYEEYNHGGCKVRLYADFSMYSSGSFAEIMDVTNTRWKIESSGGWTLEDTHSGYTKMSPNRFEIYGDATITVASTSSGSASVSYQSLVGAGFNVTGSMSSTWYARKIIDGGFVYSI